MQTSCWDVGDWEVQAEALCSNQTVPVLYRAFMNNRLYRNNPDQHLENWSKFMIKFLSFHLFIVTLHIYDTMI